MGDYGAVRVLNASVFDTPAEVFMAMKLQADHLRKTSGTIEYNEAFSNV
jgi:predicted N-acetyltransferase YhbS